MDEGNALNSGTANAASRYSKMVVEERQSSRLPGLRNNLHVALARHRVGGRELSFCCFITYFSQLDLGPWTHSPPQVPRLSDYTGVFHRFTDCHEKMSLSID